MAIFPVARCRIFRAAEGGGERKGAANFVSIVTPNRAICFENAVCHENAGAQIARNDNTPDTKLMQRFV